MNQFWTVLSRYYVITDQYLEILNGERFPLVWGIQYALIDLSSLRQKRCWLLHKNGLKNRLLFREEERASRGAIHSVHLRASLFSLLCQLRSARLPGISGTPSSFVRLAMIIYWHSAVISYTRDLTLQVNIARPMPYMFISLFWIALYLSGICPPASAPGLDSIGPGTSPFLRQSSSQDSP